jgi:hypothetical protein
MHVRCQIYYNVWVLWTVTLICFFSYHALSLSVGSEPEVPRLESTEAIVIVRGMTGEDLVLPRVVTAGSVDAIVGGDYLGTGAALLCLRREKGQGRANDVERTTVMAMFTIGSSVPKLCIPAPLPCAPPCCLQWRRRRRRRPRRWAWSATVMNCGYFGGGRVHPTVRIFARPRPSRRISAGVRNWREEEVVRQGNSRTT